MPLLLLLVVVFFPRLGAVLLEIFSGWFTQAGIGLLVFVIGLIFAPITMIWYSVVMNVFGGQWGILQIIVMVLAIMADFSGPWGGWRHYHVVHNDDVVVHE